MTPVDRGPTSMALDGDPNGLFWDDATSTLFIADSDNNRILRFTDAGGVGKVADLPAAPQDGPGLGQLVKTADGTLVVTRFGFGTAGDVVFVKPDGSTGKVPNLDVTRRRIGLTVAADGTLYDSFFVKVSTQLGTVAKLDLAGTETQVLGGLQKPVGVLAVGGNLFVSDQATNSIAVAPIQKPSDLKVLSQITTPDLLCEGPNGSLFTGGLGGDVRRVAADGSFTTQVGGFHSVRGVAYDAKNKRLFVSDHDATGGMNAVAIVPVDN